jgi:hypothetical protein
LNDKKQILALNQELLCDDAGNVNVTDPFVFKIKAKFTFFPVFTSLLLTKIKIF